MEKTRLSLQPVLNIQVCQEYQSVGLNISLGALPLLSLTLVTFTERKWMIQEPNTSLITSGKTCKLSLTKSK